MNSAFKRRLPTYLTGLCIGLTVLVITTQLKRAFAPTFLESNEVRAQIRLAPNGTIRLKYAQEPGYFLIPGFPTYLKLGKLVPGQAFVPAIQLAYRELTEKEVVIGPLPESGTYEVRAELYICARPGEAVCVKRMLVLPVVVGGEGQREAIIPVDLEAMLKVGLVNQPVADPKIAPSQSK